MMQRSVIILITFLLSIKITLAQQGEGSGTGEGRPDSTAIVNANPGNVAEDEEFNLFLMTLIMIALCAMLDAAIVGAFAATLFI